NKRQDFIDVCPFKTNECGSVEPPSYCDKCYEEGKYNINNGRKYNELYESNSSSYRKIQEEHNKKLAKECEFGTEKNCKYKDYWEKCVYCDKEFSR
ncbi:MAG: hypothetical protein K2M23_03075, partial [Alphaproteobacteria bacterium]|nr:hypothetical protein [Alphaproteobacteria bacterium]